MLDGFAPQNGVALHDLELMRLVTSGLEQDIVRNTDLANVVQGGRLEQHGNVGVAQVMLEARMVLQLLGQRLDVKLGAPDVVAGVTVAGFRERGHGQNGHILDGGEFLGAPRHFLLKVVILVAQKVGRRLQGQMGLDALLQYGRADGLGDVVHRAQLEAHALVFDLGLGSEKNDPDVARLGVLLEPLADLVAVHARHHDVEQDQIWRLIRGGDAQGLFAIVGHPHNVVVAQQAADQRQVVGRVIDHQDGGFLGEIEGIHGWV